MSYLEDLTAPSRRAEALANIYRASLEWMGYRRKDLGFVQKPDPIDLSPVNGYQFPKPLPPSSPLDRDELSGWRGRRQRATEELYDKAKALRGFCRGLFKGREGDRFLGLRGTLPREPKELHAVFGPVIRRIADAEWPLPEDNVEGLGIDRDKMVGSLIERYDDLSQALVAIKTGETQEAVAKAARQRAKTAHNTLVDKSCRYLEAALELAGLDELAATVRPDVGRRGRPAKNKLAASAALSGDGEALPATTGGLPPTSFPADTLYEATHDAATEPAAAVVTPDDLD